MSAADLRSDETKEQDERVHRAVAAEREQCAKIAEARAAIFRSGAAGLCTTVLEKECERIAFAIRQSVQSN